MGIRAHRVKVIEYADNTLFKRGAGKLGDFLENHEDTNSQIEGEGGQIEFPFRVLKEALEQAEELKLDPYDIDTLKAEIKTIEEEGKDDDDYIIYHLF